MEPPFRTHTFEQGQAGARVAAALAATYYKELVEQNIPAASAAFLTGKWISSMTTAAHLENTFGVTLKEFLKWLRSS